MKKQNIDFLESQRHCYERIVKAGCVTEMNLRGMVHVWKDEWEPNFVVDENDADEVFDFVKRLYERFDKWKAENQ